MGGCRSSSCRGIALWLVRSLLGAIVMASAAIPAAAQFTFGSGGHDDKNAPILFRADQIQYDEQLALTIARGHVEISQNGMVLLADTVTYNQRTDTVTASGNVSLTQPTGEIVFAEFMELRDSMSQGFAKNVRMLFADRSRLAANTMRRTNDNHTELARGVYSPCDLCKDDPTAPPLRPGAVVCIGLNYADHVRESGMETPKAPLVFAKLPQSAIGPGAAIELDATVTTQADWEVEGLGVLRNPVAG